MASYKLFGSHCVGHCSPPGHVGAFRFVRQSRRNPLVDNLLSLLNANNIMAIKVDGAARVNCVLACNHTAKAAARCGKMAHCHH